MNDRWWRVHLLLLGWAAVAVAGAAVGLHYLAPPDRFRTAGAGLRLDGQTGEVRVVSDRWPGGEVVMEAYRLTPTAIRWPTHAPPTPAARIIDDLD